MKAILKELIEHLFAFVAEYHGPEEYTMNDFLGYMNSRTGKDHIRIRKIAGDKAPWMSKDYSNTGSDISILVVLMFRYARGYIKKVLINGPIRTADEFSFLITLMTFSSLTKTELINKQVMEKTSGAEIIRRLIRRGFIAESEDIGDKRCIRVSITEKGRVAVSNLLPKMSDVSKIVVGNLTPEETNTLAYLLKKLDYFHNDIYMHRRNVPLNELISGLSAQGRKF